MHRFSPLVLVALLMMGCHSDSLPPQPSRATLRPTYRSEIIGYSVQKRPIERVVFQGDASRTVLVMAAIHGNEQASIDIAKGLFELLKAEPQRAQGRRVVIIPVANPDGVAANTRLNANRIDLNRNFPAKNFKPGPRAHTPLGEPESAAIAQQIQTLRPSLLISIHSIDGKRECNNFDGPAQPVAKAMSQANGYPVTGDIGYPVPGSLGSWAGKELQIPTITLELPRGLSGPDAWRNNRAAMLAALAQP